ncbi:diadenosine tetraphosphate (Ap4A) HIT family hydrolase [Streptomyces sp. LBL]|uniref:HIT family protein n=1 Tax=Streptomyces sp. LBL TaxID=2940562 RepID=UPI002475FC4C|nr:hypothetical protein [Streptomyces sp. LBL]MDH6629843.1 diadenosine tetraphosphate (Ap4A) HIT family hydrolase [Streptomyces sp. LBL]
MPEEGCPICQTVESTAEAQLVHRDKHWTASAAMSVPGWFLLCTNRHNQGIWELTEAEAELYGPLLARLSSAIRQAGDAEKVYVLSAGESAPHFHALVMARGAQIPEDWRAMALLGKAAELSDADEANRVAKAVRETFRTLPC